MLPRREAYPAVSRLAVRVRLQAVAKLSSLHLHDLRHTAASQAVMSGEGLPLVGRLLGHNRHRTTAGYAHLADAHLAEAAERAGATIAKAMRNAERRHLRGGASPVRAVTCGSRL